MNKYLKVGLVVVVSLIVMAAAVWFLLISPPKFIWQAGLPDIAKDLPSNFADAEQVFNQRIQARFSDGMDVAELTRQLQEDGFAVDAGGAAQISKQKFPCTLTWRVTWTNNIAGKATNIEGSYGGICL